MFTRTLHAPSDEGNLWASVGYGQGELVKQEGGAESRSDTRLLSLSAGVSNQLSQSGQLDLNLKSDIALAQVDIVGSADNKSIPSDKLSSQRLRLLLEMNKKHPLASGGHFKPLVEVGLRYDGGSGKSGIDSGQSGIGAILVSVDAMPTPLV